MGTNSKNGMKGDVSMTNFANAARNEGNVTRTLNGAKAWSTTDSKVLDLFSKIGGMRQRLGDIPDAMQAAWNENPELTMKMAFYARDIRGGLSERDIARTAMLWLAKYHPNEMKKNLQYVADYGRWDDLYTFVGTKLEADVFRIIRNQLKSDMTAVKSKKPCSLLAKWLKSTNASSEETNKLGRLTAKRLKMPVREYRKMLSALRKYISVTEVDMSSNNWESIAYEQVPSKAMTNYRNAFIRHDSVRFNGYMDKVRTGESKINASTLFPYDIAHQYMSSKKVRMGGYYYTSTDDAGPDDVIEAQWKALPNYLDDECNVMVIADTSGSMMGQPIESALSLAIYFAERNKGPYHNLFMTFSSDPAYVTLDEQSFYGNLKKAAQAPWMGTTNLEKAFDKILATAIDNNLRSSELPKALVIISDMQIDPYRCGESSDFLDAMKRKYASYGYELPYIVFWCVNSWSNVVHSKRDKYCAMFSGNATSTFRSVVQSIGYTAYEAMLKTLNSDRYSRITI